MTPAQANRFSGAFIATAFGLNLAGLLILCDVRWQVLFVLSGAATVISTGLTFWADRKQCEGEE